MLKKMKKKEEFCVVMTTIGNHEETNKIIDALINDRLAACIQEVNIGSHYLWKEEVCHDVEILLLIKTTWSKYDLIKSTIKSLHSYETPEIIAINIEEGDKSYLDWVRSITEQRI